MELQPLSLLIVGLAVFLQWPCTASGIILCDGHCSSVNNTGEGVDVCMKPNKSQVRLLVMGLFPCEVQAFRARGLTVAAQMAIRSLQNSTTVLPNHHIELSLSNTMCSGLVGVREFINQLLDDVNPRYMIIGPGCSTGAVRIAEIAPFWNLTQISYTTTSISLSDKRRFPNFLRTISSDNASITASSSIIRQYGWQQVAIITQINELFSNLTSVESRVLEDDGVRVVTERLSFNGGLDDTRGVVQQLNESGARIVILNVFENFAREIFCVAYKRGMTHPRYVFLSFYWYTEFWWRDNITRGDNRYDPEFCDQFQLMAALHRSFAPDYFTTATPEEADQPTDVGYTPNGFWEEFVKTLDALNYPPSDAIRQAVYAYDAVWAAGFALDTVAEELELHNMTITDFNYSRSDINEMILKVARGLDFRGVSGRVKFNAFGDRDPSIQFYQYRFEDPQDVNANLPPVFARIDAETGRFKYDEGEGERTVFPDGIPKAAEKVYIQHTLFGFYTALSCLGILFATFCLFFNLMFRKKKIVKLSSPFLNVLIILGAIIFYVEVILFGVDENIASHDTVDVLCQAHIWVASIGFSLFFGTMLAKTWRVYYIFRSVKLKKKPLKDWMLILMVAGLVAIDLVFLAIITFWRLELQEDLEPREGGEIPQIFSICDSDESKYWLPVLLTYKAVFLLIGLFLAVETYNVKIKELRDSKLIVASVCGIAVVSLVLALVIFLIDNDPDATYGVTGMFILLLVTAILTLLFVTKMIELWKNPSGEFQVTTIQPRSDLSATQLQTLSSEDSAKIAHLRQTIQSLRAELELLRQTKQTSEDERMNIDSSEAILVTAAQGDNQEGLDYTSLGGEVGKNGTDSQTGTNDGNINIEEENSLQLHEAPSGETDQAEQVHRAPSAASEKHEITMDFV